MEYIPLKNTVNLHASKKNQMVTCFEKKKLKSETLSQNVPEAFKFCKKGLYMFYYFFKVEILIILVNL